MITKKSWNKCISDYESDGDAFTVIELTVVLYVQIRDAVGLAAWMGG